MDIVVSIVVDVIKFKRKKKISTLPLPNLPLPLPNLPLPLPNLPNLPLPLPNLPLPNLPLPLPNLPDDIYTLLNEMNEKYKLLEQKVEELTQQTMQKQQTKKHISSIAAILNKAFPVVSNNGYYDDWVSSIKTAINQKHLNLMFKNKYADAFVLIIIDLIENNNIIRAFNQEKNTLYVPFNNNNNNNNNIWNILTDATLTALINLIAKQILQEFVKWQKVIFKQTESDDALAKEYAEQVVKLLGNKIPSDKLCTMVKHDIYKKIKSDIYSI